MKYTGHGVSHELYINKKYMGIVQSGITHQALIQYIQHYNRL
jgi:hypothetical protein